MIEKVYTTLEAAQRLNCDPSHVRRVIGERKLDAEKWGRDWRITEGAIVAYETKHPKSKAGRPRMARTEADRERTRTAIADLKQLVADIGKRSLAPINSSTSMREERREL